MQLKKIIFVSFLLFLFFFLSFPVSVSAALVNINPQGGVVVNVLSSQDASGLTIPKRESLDVTENVAGESGKITLTRTGDKISMAVATQEGERQLDVTGYPSEILEVEERPQTQKVQIALEGSDFVIRQEGVSALTSFPIIVDPQTAELALATDSGIKFVAILPSAALQSVLRAKIINRFPPGAKLELAEIDGVLAYKVNGEKILNLFNVLDYPVGVESVVSASTGEIIKTNEPIWLKVASFMFS